MDRSVTTTRHVEGTWVVLDGAKYVRARVSASSDMDETPGQLMTKFGDVWRINVMATDDGLTSDEARKAKFHFPYSKQPHH